jgi:hypothetical protein
VSQATAEPVGQLADRIGLVAGGLERGDELEIGHADGTSGVRIPARGAIEQVFS